MIESFDIELQLVLDTVACIIRKLISGFMGGIFTFLGWFMEFLAHTTNYIYVFIIMYVLNVDI